MLLHDNTWPHTAQSSCSGISSGNCSTNHCTVWTWPLSLSLVPPPCNFPSIAELYGWQKVEMNGGKLAEHTGGSPLWGDTKVGTLINTTNVVIQQNSRKLLMMDILMSETCWAHKKWNKIASDIKLVFYSSTFPENLHTTNNRHYSYNWYALYMSTILANHLYMGSYTNDGERQDLLTAHPQHRFLFLGTITTALSLKIFETSPLILSIMMYLKTDMERLCWWLGQK